VAKCLKMSIFAYLKNVITLIIRLDILPFHTVNQRVLGSSPREGAKAESPAVMLDFF